MDVVASQERARWSSALIVVALGLLALLPRVLGLADFVTTDEAYHWISRVERFSAALASQRWAATAQTGHPGVTIMWLGSLGLAIERAATSHGWAGVPTPVEHLAWLRLPSAALEAALAPLGYALLRRIVAPATALIAALLWATSPYLIAHARLLHLDALLTSFVTLSLLLLLVATSGGRDSPAVGRRALAGSGVCAGLALLTKGPALILLPCAGLLLLWRIHADSPAQRVRRAVGWYLAWIGAAALVVFAAWPALWVDPGHAIGSYVDEIVSNGGRPNGDGQFFLGRAVDDPGPLFYPFVDLFRATPATLLGIAALPLAWRAARRRDPNSAPSALLALAAFALFWTAVMTIGPKKFDRYVLPTWPALLTLSAAGWAALFGLLEKAFARPAAARWALAGLLLALECSQPALYHPYYLSYYNPLLGGGAAAQRDLLIGWGEGMDQAGAYLRARPDIADGPVLSALGQTLRPFLPVPVKDVTELGEGANYAVAYRESLQRAANPEIYAAIQQTEPLYTVTIHGIDYAWIYQIPKPFAQALPARFGDALRLRGVTLAHAPGQITLTPSWDVRGRIAADELAFLHLIGPDGRRVAQVDVAPGGDRPTSAWQPGEQIAVPLTLALPAGLPPGDYQLTMGVYDAASGARLPLAEGRAADPASAGRDALLIGTVAVP